LKGSKKNELSWAIYFPYNCYQEVFVKDLFRLEKNKTDRQHFRAATLPVDEGGYFLHYQYCINKKFSFHPGYRTI
jgi:hypothetical protein